MAYIFWLCGAVIAYTYFGYPLLVRFLCRVRSRPVRKSAIEPSVSLIIAAYNEEKTIQSKIDNTLALEYPAEKLEILIAAYGSTDRTVQIASQYADRNVRVLHRPGREGKTAALNRAVAESKHEILFFSDANTFYAPATVRNIVRNFADDDVGGVSGRKVVLKDDQREATEGEVAYWSYESSLKHSESLLGSIVTADGEIFAMRCSLFEQMPVNIVHDDMYLSLGIVSKGKRLVYERDATSAEHASRTLWDEFHLKVRYASAGYQILSSFRRMLLPPRNLFSWQFVSHKVLRWMAPFFLLGAFISSALNPAWLYQSAFWLQAGFYSVAIVGVCIPRINAFPMLYFPVYFSVMNTAALYGFARFFTTGQSPLWRKAER